MFQTNIKLQLWRAGTNHVISSEHNMQSGHKQEIMLAATMSSQVADLTVGKDVADKKYKTLRR